MDNILTPLDLNNLCGFIDAVMPEFEKDFKEGEDNERRFLGNNYSKKEESEIKGQGRQPLSIPVIKTKLTNISGEQRKRRTSFKIEAAVDPNDEIKAELASLQVKAVERRSNFKFLESDIFDAGIGIKYAVSEMALETEAYHKRVMVKELNYRNFIWDRNSYAYDINDDALWCCKIEIVPRKFLEEIEGIDTSNISEGSLSSFKGREYLNYYVSTSDKGSEYDLLSLFHFYIKQPRKVYCVLFPDSENLFSEGVILEKFTSKREAERKLREYEVEYVLNGFKPEGEIHIKTELKLDYYKFCYNKILEYEQTDLEMFPFNLFRAITFNGKYASLMDFLKDPQKVIDRMWMQVDYSIGKSLKNLFLIVEDLIDEPIETAIAKINKTGGVIAVKDLARKAIEEVTSKGANPQWFQVIELMVRYLEDLTGGVNFQGGAIGSNQSGISQKVLAQEGQKLAIPLLENLSRWKQSVGKNILWWLQHYETEEDVIKIQGGALTEEMIQLLNQNNIYTPSQFKKDGSGYIKINNKENQLSYLKDASFELYITEAELSDTDKQMRLQNYNNAAQQDPALLQSPTFNRLRLEAMNLKISDVQQILKEREAFMQMQAQSEQENRNMEKAKILISDKGNLTKGK